MRSKLVHMMGRVGQAAAIAIAAVLVGSGPAMAEKWILTSPYAENEYQTKKDKIFADEVKKATNGKIEIEVVANAALYKLPETKRAVQTGQVAMGEVFLSALSNEDPIYGIGTIPFICRDIKDAAALWEVHKPIVEQRFEKQGLKLLFGVTWPAQSMFTKKKVDTFADLRATKFRVQNPSTTRLAELMGATGVRVETMDLPQSFLTGIIDGMYTSDVTTANLKGWDYIKYSYQVNAWYPKNVTFMNKRQFDGLDKNTQKIIMDLAAKTEKLGWGMEAEETKEKVELLRKNGVAIVQPSEKLMTEFAVIGKQMLDEWLKQTGAEGSAFVAAYNKKRGM